MKSYTLVIWQNIPKETKQNIPKETKLYLIPDDEISPEQRRLLKEANGKIINSDPNCEGLDFVNAAFSEDEFEGSRHINDLLIISVCV